LTPRRQTSAGEGEGRPPLRRPLALALVAAVLLAAGLALVLAVRAGRTAPSSQAAATYVGSERCASCHPDETARWRPSNHARAMQAATEQTVLGDFNGTTLEHRGKTWRFFRKGDKFVVSAEGPDGAMHDYEVAYTFGVAPLQQYLVPFPGGRLQALSAGWDVKEKRWFHVNPRGPAAPGDWLHWTRAGQNWNGMCADCHSTNVRKNYDPTAIRPDHVVGGLGGLRALPRAELATRGGASGPRASGRGSRTRRWSPDLQADRPGAGRSLRVSPCPPGAVRTRTPRRRALDRYLPTLLASGLFHPDGQILDEDFERQAFSQSKMYAFGVRCTDCHDVHSGKRLAEGNAPAPLSPGAGLRRALTTSTRPSGRKAERRGALRLVPHARAELHGGPLPA
jgi:cytochrome c553